MREGWKKERLIDVTKFIDYRGRTPNKTDNGIRLITAKNVKMGVLNKKPEEFIAEEDYDDWMTRGIPEQGDVLFTTEAPLAMVALLDTNEKIALAQRIITLCPNRKILLGEYLHYCLQSKDMQDNILSKGTGATVTGIKSKILKEILVPIPPLQEQTQIVKTLDIAFKQIDQAKANLEQNLHNAKELFTSKLNEVFSQRGEGWEEKYLEDICTKITDGVHKKPDYTESGVPFIKIKNLTKGSGISFSDISYISNKDHQEYIKRTKPEKDDILITKDGTIGVVRVIETDIEFSIFVSLALIKPIDKKITPYLKYVLISPLIQNQIKPQGTALKHLYLRDLRKFTIPIPSIEKQNVIVNTLNKINVETENLQTHYQQKLNNLEELKKSILQKAFRGEL